jgi:hypothetical protein
MSVGSSPADEALLAISSKSSKTIIMVSSHNFVMSAEPAYVTTRMPQRHAYCSHNISRGLSTFTVDIINSNCAETLG